MRHILPILSTLLIATTSLAAPARFELKDGDRVILLGNTLVERAQRYGHCETALLARHADRRLVFRNLGWSGDTVWAESRGLFDPPAKGYQRMLAHVGRLKPSVLILGYGSNASFAGEKGLPPFLDQYRRLITDLVDRCPPGVRVVLCSATPQQRPGLPRLPTPVNKGTRLPSLQFITDRNLQIEEYNRAIARLAREDRHTFLDLFTCLERSQEKQATPPRITVDGRSLNSRGYRLLAMALVEQFDGNVMIQARISSQNQLTLSAPLPVHQARWQDRRLTFSFAEPTSPLVIRVSGLPRGRYELQIDGTGYGSATAREFANGIAPALTGPGRDWEQLRQAVVAKNRLYFHRWRPQNTTYLFGFRKHEQGQNAEEVAQFEKLVAEREADIDRLKRLVVRRLEISRSK